MGEITTQAVPLLRDCGTLRVKLDVLKQGAGRRTYVGPSGNLLLQHSKNLNKFLTDSFWLLGGPIPNQTRSFFTVVRRVP